MRFWDQTAANEVNVRRLLESGIPVGRGGGGRRLIPSPFSSSVCVCVCVCVCDTEIHMSST